MKYIKEYSIFATDEGCPKGFEILSNNEEGNEIYPGKLSYIQSVKRLLDGEVFTIGDEVESYGSSFGKLTCIWISGDQMRADIGNMGLVLNHEDLKVVVEFLPYRSRTADDHAANHAFE